MARWSLFDLFFRAIRVNQEHRTHCTSNCQGNIQVVKYTLLINISISITFFTRRNSLDIRFEKIHTIWSAIPESCWNQKLLHKCWPKQIRAESNIRCKWCQKSPKIFYLWHFNVLRKHKSSSNTKPKLRIYSTFRLDCWTMRVPC